MKYGITRINAQDAIISTLKKHEKLRYGELSKMIVDDKKICSDRIFREVIAEMVENNFVQKIEISRNKTLYTINSEITALSDEDVKNMVSGLADLKDEAKKILDIISSDADESDKANEVIKFLLLLSTYEMQYMMLSHVSGKPKLKQYTDELTKLKKSVLYSLNKKSSAMFSTLGALVYGKLFVEAMKQLPEEMESFVNEFNY